MICCTSFHKSRDTLLTQNIAHTEYTCAGEILKKNVVKVNYWGEPERAPHLLMKRKLSIYISVCGTYILLIDLIHETILYYIIHFRMAKVHESPLAAVFTGVSRET